VNAALRCAALLALAAPAGAQELAFATPAEARQVLGTRDAFVERLSPFDRAARMKTDRTVGEAEFLAFVESAALAWDGAEQRAIAATSEDVLPKIRALHLPLPPKVYLVKTTGQEEGDTVYTRQAAIMIPRSKSGDSRRLPRTLAHELFHVASRANPAFAEKAYGVIGFTRCAEATYPTELAPRKLTNPDAPRNDYCIRLTFENRPVAATPILFSRADTYDTKRGGEFFDYLQLGLLLRALPGEPPARERVVDLPQVTGFFEQVGENTQYVIHPEEILADNFALLALGAPNVKSPAVLDGLRRVLEEFAAAPAAPR
jgi:hypothetical protein